MIERWLYKLSQILSPERTFYIACGVLIISFIYWLIKYQFCRMCAQKRRIKVLCKTVSSYKGLKKDLIPLLGKKMKGTVNQAVWQEYEAAVIARRPVALRTYFTYTRIYDIPCGKEIMSCYKWYMMVLGFAFSVLGWILIKVGERLTFLQAVFYGKFIYVIFTAGVTVLIALLYSVIENSSYSSALKGLERFCSLCDRALPTVRREGYEVLQVNVELMLKKQDALFEKLAELEAKMDGAPINAQQENKTDKSVGKGTISQTEDKDELSLFNGQDEIVAPKKEVKISLVDDRLLDNISEKTEDLSQDSEQRELAEEDEADLSDEEDIEQE